MLYQAPLVTAPPVSGVPLAAVAPLIAALPAGMAAPASALTALILAGTLAAPAAMAVLAGVGVAPEVAEAVLLLAGRRPAVHGTTAQLGVAGRAERRQAASYRAAFILTAAWRCQKAWATGGPAALRRQLRLERAWFTAHVAALRHRAQHAAQVDDARRRYGPILGWRLGPTKTHTPECVAAAGHRFTVTPPPIIGLPGTVHPGCACTAGPDPGPQAGWVDDAVIALTALGGD